MRIWKRWAVVGVLVAAGAIAACASDANLTVDEKVSVAQLEEDLTDARVETDKWEAEAKEAIAEATAAAIAADSARLDAATMRFESATDGYRAAVAEEDRVGGEIAAIHTAANERSTKGVLGMIAPFVPAPLQPLLFFGGSLITAFGSRRQQKHLLNTAKSGLKLQLGDLVRNFLKATGAGHTSAATAEVAAIEDGGGKAVVSNGGAATAGVTTTGSA